MNNKTKTILLLLLATIVVFFSAKSAFADQQYVGPQKTDFGVVTNVSPVYRTRSYKVPTESCSVVDVPIYGSVHVESNTGDVIAGAILGGVIGHQFGGGSGKDAMTALGAIVGSNVAGRPRVGRGIVGYRQERSCRTVYVDQSESFVSSYEVTFKYQDNYTTFNSATSYAVGDRIEVRVMTVPVYK